MIGKPTPLYYLRVMQALLQQGKAIGIEPDEMVEFLGTQVQRMIQCPPNCTRYKSNIWIVRGFYPKTSLFFKLTVSEKSNTGSWWGLDSKYYAKAQLLVCRNGPREIGVMFSSDTVNEVITGKMENIMLDGTNDKLSFFEKRMTMPKCMSPKGMQLFKAPRRRKSDKV